MIATNRIVRESASAYPQSFWARFFNALMTALAVPVA